MQPAMQTAKPIEPKIDVNVTLLQILKILARIADTLGVKIPASEMVATQGDLTQFGMQQATNTGDPAGASAIPPIQPIQPAMPSAGGGDVKAGSHRFNNGTPFDTAGLDMNGNKAAALMRVRASRHQHLGRA